MKKANARNWIAVSIVMVFIAWLMPLGIFIKPSMEKLACDGQRAVCLCSSRPGQGLVNKNMETTTKIKTARVSIKDPAGSSGANHHFVASLMFTVDLVAREFYYERLRFLYQSPDFASVDHVPKC